MGDEKMSSLTDSLGREGAAAAGAVTPDWLPRTVPAPSYRWARAGAALYGAGLRELLRDPLALAMMAVVPLLFVLLFGVVFRGPSGPMVRLGVAAAPHGVIARTLTHQFRG